MIVDAVEAFILELMHPSSDVTSATYVPETKEAAELPTRIPPLEPYEGRELAPLQSRAVARLCLPLRSARKVRYSGFTIATSRLFGPYRSWLVRREICRCRQKTSCQTWVMKLGIMRRQWRGRTRTSLDHFLRYSLPTLRSGTAS